MCVWVGSLWDLLPLPPLPGGALSFPQGSPWSLSCGGRGKEVGATSQPLNKEPFSPCWVRGGEGEVVLAALRTPPHPSHPLPTPFPPPASGLLSCAKSNLCQEPAGCFPLHSQPRTRTPPPENPPPERATTSLSSTLLWGPLLSAWLQPQGWSWMLDPPPPPARWW